MQIIRGKTNFDFIGKWRIAVFISSVLNILILVGIFAWPGLNFGVDFAGGTVVEVKFEQSLEPAQVREGVVKGGVQEPQVQRIGSASENSFILRLGGVTQLTLETEKPAGEALKSLGSVSQVVPDFENGLIRFRVKLPALAEGETSEQQDKAFKQKVLETVVKSGMGVKEVRRLGDAPGGEVDYQVVSAGMADKITQALKTGLPGQNFEVRRIDYVGPQVGQALRNKGVAALLLALLAILIYVAFRFDLKFGPGALAATVHDVIMVAGYYVVTQREFNLTSIAVLLTVLGYSINDTIVIYDRIREEMVRYKGKPLPEIINIAVNDTLSRTILTSLVTALSLVGLLIFGVGEIFDFAAAMLVGIIVGTYSSVYIASPLTILLDEREAAQRRRGNATQPA